MPLIQITAPASDPITAAEVKASARIDGAEFDIQLAIIIPALVKQAEALTGRVFIARTMELVLDGFPAAEIDLVLPNVTSIVSVKYVDPNGITQTMADTDYALDSDSTPCWLLPALGTTWPVSLVSANALRIRFDAGFGADASAVPQDIRLWLIASAVQAIQSPDGKSESPSRWIDSLLDPYRLLRC